MLTTYLFPLLAVIALCAFWAVFQMWLYKHDPEATRRSLKCGGCNRQDKCGGADPGAG